MAVEEVRGHVYIHRELHQHELQQEFAIEIPDAEADEIKTVQQGAFPPPILYGPSINFL
jgi:hypothetical protein